MGKQKLPPNSGEAPPNALLGELLKAKGFAASEPANTPTATPAKSGEAAIDLSKTGKLVVRREKKGRGGKTVTLVSGLALPAPRMEALARAMRKGLGCGSTVENGVIVLQGDIQDRAQDWLRKHGATKIVLGN